MDSGTSLELASVLARGVRQLTLTLGEAGARELIDKALRAIGHRAPATADELLSVANVLIAEGGFTEVVGRGLKAHALLRGATIAPR